MPRSANAPESLDWKSSDRSREARRHSGSDVDLLIEFRPDVHLGWDFFELQELLEALLGCKVDLLTRRSVERDPNPIRRHSILESTLEVYAAIIWEIVQGDLPILFMELKRFFAERGEV